MRDRPILVGSLVVILNACGFGLLGVLSRFSYRAGLEPIPFVAWRASFGLLVILAIVAARARDVVALVDPRRLSGDDRLGLIVVGLAALGLNAAMFLAFDLTTIALVLLAFYTYPALVALVAVVLGHERPPATEAMAPRRHRRCRCGGHPVDALPRRAPRDWRHASGDPHADRAARRRDPRGAPSRRDAHSGSGARRRRDPRRGPTPPAWRRGRRRD